TVLSRSKKINFDYYKKRLQLINHRGPDDEGYYFEDQLFLGHKRLSILDLSERGRQPLKSPSGKTEIIYNGEIYNYIEIKNDLLHLNKDLNFNTETDTEVILAAYEEYGIHFLNKLNGMFTFVLIDRENSKIIVARDRFGIKPLYYRYINDILIISSEIKGLINERDNVKPNAKIVFDFLTLGRVDHLDETFFEDIDRFPAGHYAEISLINNSNLKFKLEKWWSIEKSIKELQKSKKFRERTISEHVTVVSELLKTAVKLRLRSDVPVGSCLSGGIDSSSIVCLASKFLDDGPYTFQTFSATYGSWFVYDESNFINLVIENAGVVGNNIVPTLEIVNSDFGKFIYHQEEPVPSFSPFTQYLVMKLANNHGLKVLLDGQGADEIFAGYSYMTGYFLVELLLKLKLYSFIKTLFTVLKERNSFAIKTFLYQLVPTFISRRLVQENTKFLKKEFQQKHRDQLFLNSGLYKSRSLEKALINHLKYKLQHLLRWEDKNSMAYSIEARTPFLDFNLVVYVLSIPGKLKINNGIRKWCLREAMRGTVPDKILNRIDKIGFAAPDSIWIRNEKNILVKQLLESHHPYLDEIINWSKMNEVIKNYNNNKLTMKEENLIFRISCLNMWLKTYFANGL
ncbi:MAG: asparagine synthase (glutamine-hydrolyzing), partial [Promethearchaeota archaeon]